MYCFTVTNFVSATHVAINLPSRRFYHTIAKVSNLDDTVCFYSVQAIENASKLLLPLLTIQGDGALRCLLLPLTMQG